MNDHRNGTNGNGAYLSNGHNGANGNGHEKIFDLSRRDDPMLATVVPGARKRVAVMHQLSFGARNFFAWLTDQSLTPGANITKGVLKISDHDAGVRFKVHSKTIRNWKRELENTGEVWLTEKWMKNSFPQTVYNISAIVGQATLPLNADSNDGSLVEDVVFSSNRRRQQSARRDPSTGRFDRRYPASPAPVQTPPGVPGPEVSPAVLRNQAETEPSGIFLPATTATDCRPPRHQFAGHHGKTVPSPTATDCRPARQIGAVADGKTVPSSPAMGCRSERQQVAGNGKTEIRESVLKENGGSPTPPDLDVQEAIKDGDTAFDDWRSQWKPDTYRSKLEKELSRIRVKLMHSPSAFWKRRADFLQTRLDGGKPPVTKPGPARSVKPAAPAKVIPFADRKKLFDKAKAEAGL